MSFFTKSLINFITLHCTYYYQTYQMFAYIYEKKYS